MFPRVQGGRLVAAAIVAGTLIGGAGEAQAFTNVRVTGGTLLVIADVARANRISVVNAGANVRVRDTGDFVSLGPGCWFVDAHTADCPRNTIARGRVLARDLDDQVLTFTSVPFGLSGDQGDDVLRGGSGDDLLDGGLDADIMFGDTGEDTATYAAKAAPVQVILDNAANDGVAGEQDNVSSTIENVVGSSLDDVLFGSAADNELTGGLGNDRVFGQDGNDTFPSQFLDGKDEYAGGNGIDHINYAQRLQRVVVQLDGMANDGEIAAGEGDNVRLDVEHVTTGSGNDVLIGSILNNRLDGGNGIDLIDGRGGLDQLFGGAGDDQLRAFDGTGGDVLNGQADTDTCASDLTDTEIDCEL